MNKVILVGKAASGKDHLRKILEGRGFKYGVSYTTRSPRPGEVDGKDYYFMDDSQFQEAIENGIWYEWIEFNGWKYGTTKEQFNESCNLFIMTPKGISHISPIDRKFCTIIYLDISNEIREARLTERSDNNDSIERRIQADHNDFMMFTDYDIKINDPNF